tara:strand:- start:5539 stop:6240 length:702 start_codon:yes stop_codon:yes gene_type:complete
MTICIIPARGGSKRIPRKNIRPFAGRPMIEHSIRAAELSGCFDRVIVSTDDEEIAAVARAAGAEAPFLRPADLADDHATTQAVMAHALDWLAEREKLPEFVCCIYATAPFLRPEDLRDGLDKLKNSDALYAFSVTSYAFPIQRAVKITKRGRVEAFTPEYNTTRSQDLEEAFHDAGQFYWGKTTAFREGKPVFAPHSLPIILPRHRVQDIDTEEDWTRAELMYRVMTTPEGHG